MSFFIWIPLLFSLQWSFARSARPYDVCYADGSVCDAYLDIKCDIKDYSAPKTFYECICVTKLPLQQSCDECVYEYGIASTVDNSYWTSVCSSQGVEIGTIPVSAQISFAARTQTMSVPKSRTFNSAAMLSSYSVKATASTSKQFTTPTVQWWTSTYGGAQPGSGFVPVETAPPSVEDIGDGKSGGRTNTAGLALGAICLVVALLWC
ncbi:hypothetical protein QBC38DRAFT_280082 [Podospora fimiseda]|uniref:Uncharacterized protein n=1 Tax=Podospora fimiseda TaxID=252190 RepID=A0AAN7GUD8_9PEZI|nr:hypothetical protein QBC38DRAFT_280082 [Podospora fimiseda]